METLPMSRLAERRAVKRTPNQPMQRPASQRASARCVAAADRRRWTSPRCTLNKCEKKEWWASCATSVVVRGLIGSAIIARAMRSRRYLRAWSPLMLLVGGWLGAAAVPAHAAPDHASVLILLPGQPGLPASTAIASGIRAALLTEWSFGGTIEREHVDVARFASREAEERRLRTVYG